MLMVYEGQSITLAFYGNSGATGRTDRNVYFTLADTANDADYIPASYNGQSSYYSAGLYAFSVTIKVLFDDVVEGLENFTVVQWDEVNGERVGYEEIQVQIIDTTGAVAFFDVNGNGAAEHLEVSALHASDTSREFQFAVAETGWERANYDQIIQALQSAEPAQKEALSEQLSELARSDKSAFRQALQETVPDVSSTMQQLMRDILYEENILPEVLDAAAIRHTFELLMDGMGYLGPYGFIFEQLADAANRLPNEDLDLSGLQARLRAIDEVRSNTLLDLIDNEDALADSIKLDETQPFNVARRESTDNVPFLKSGSVTLQYAEAGTRSVVSRDTATLGTAENDIFVLGLLNGGAVVHGGDGVDTFLISASVDDFDFVGTAGAQGLLVSSAGAVLLDGVERLTFTDGSLAIDVGEGQNAGSTFRLYQAAFDRVPDQLGLSFWIDVMDRGFSLQDMAQAFVLSDEFTTAYGANLSDSQFVSQLYENVLGRAGDPAGVEFWNTVLSNGAASRAQVLAGFSESTENIVGVAATIEDGFAYG